MSGYGGGYYGHGPPSRDSRGGDRGGPRGGRQQYGDRGGPRGGGQQYRGRGSGGGRGGRGHQPDLSGIAEVKSNMILATLTGAFDFYMYTTDTRQSDGQVMDSRHRRNQLFCEAIFNTLLKDKSPKEKTDLKERTFFQGSYFFSAQSIEGLEPENLPKQLLTGKTTGGETFGVNQVFHFTKPKCLAGFAPALQDDELAFDCRCKQCPRKAFADVHTLLQHCRDTDHEPMYDTTDDNNSQVADEPTFRQYANVVLKRALALSNRLAPWGKEFIDPTHSTEPTDRGNPLGIKVFRAFSCEFNYVRPKHATKAHFALTVDLRSKIMRNLTLLDQVCGGRDPNTAHFEERDQKRLNEEWIGQVVIYKQDNKCYPVIALRFDHSAESLPVEGLGITHAKYFKDKDVDLKYPRARPIVEVQGRRGQNIFFPAELVCGNELDPRVREQLPRIASYTPSERNAAVDEMMSYIGNEGDLLKTCGIVLAADPKDRKKAKALAAKVVVMKAPQLLAKGVRVPDRYKDNWTKGMSDAWYNTRTPNQVKLNVVLFFNNHLQRHQAITIYNKIRDFVNGLNTKFIFGMNPEIMQAFQAGDEGVQDHVAQVERFLKGKIPENPFVLDFSKTRGKTDPAYPILKHLMGAHGYLSQVLSFKTFNHGQNLDDRGAKKSNMILQGLARQILQKSGVRLWWVSLPPSLPLPAVFIGVDIFHAPRQYDKKIGRREAKPSCAAIVVQVVRSDSEHTHQVEIYSETYRRRGGEEFGLKDPLRRTIQNALKALDVNPMSCIVWRDGISDSAFDSLAREEINGVREGLRQDAKSDFLVPLYGAPQGQLKLETASYAAAVQPGPLVGASLPKQEVSGAVIVSKPQPQTPLAYIVCQKRIATKFIVTGGGLQEGAYGAPPGTLVDGIQGLKYDTFYIQGRAPPNSTPKPVRYIVIANDEDLKLNIPKLTWDMCHDYPNWTGPIKVPSPCMSAHKLAMLAGCMHDSGEEIAHRRFVNKMHFL